VCLIVCDLETSETGVLGLSWAVASQEEEEEVEEEEEEEWLYCLGERKQFKGMEVLT